MSSRLLAAPTEKKVFQRDKPHCNIGTIGHVDHGEVLKNMLFYNFSVS